MNGRPGKTPSALSLPGAVAALGRRALPALPALLALLAASVLLVPLALAAGCGKASPTAPSGSTLTLNVNPTTITSATGSAHATATLIRPNGTADPGTQVQFETSLGSFNPASQATNNSGVATSTLTGNGRVGTAKVTAFSGSVMSTEVDVMIGDLGASITLQATPPTIPSSGGTVTLLALVRDATGAPVPAAQVNFTTTVGELRSRGGLVTANGNGQATDVLTVRSTDISSQTTIMVGADTANSMGALQTATFTIAILTNAAASIIVSGSPSTTLPASGGMVNLTALVRDATGSPVAGVGVSFSTTIGTLQSGGAVMNTGSNGEVFDILTVTPQPAATSGSVTASAIGAGGTLITSTPLAITVLAPSGRPDR